MLCIVAAFGTSECSLLHALSGAMTADRNVLVCLSYKLPSVHGQLVTRVYTDQYVWTLYVLYMYVCTLDYIQFSMYGHCMYCIRMYVH